MEKPNVRWAYVGDELALFWVNPWDQKDEKIATFWWPAHPADATEQVEKWFQEWAYEFVLKANDCAFDCQFEGTHPGCKRHSTLQAPKDSDAKS